MFLNHYPLANFGRLPREMGRLFDDVFDGCRAFAPRQAGALPPLNIWQDGDCIYAEVEVPGLSEDDLDIHVVGNELTIQGQHRVTEDEKVDYQRRERYTGKITRTLALPFEVDAAKVEAKLKDGLLTIKLPMAETAKGRKIPVNSN